MATLTILLPDDKHDRLKSLAESRGMSLNKEHLNSSISLLNDGDRFHLRSIESLHLLFYLRSIGGHRGPRLFQ